MSEGDLLAYDHLFDLFTRFTIEWALADYHGIHQDSKGPYVDLRITGVVSLQQLWRHILDAAGVVTFGQSATIRAKNTEISNLNMHVGRCVLMGGQLIDLVQKDNILELHITVNNSAVVAIV